MKHNAIKTFDYSPELLSELNQIEKATGLKVTQYKYYGPDNFQLKLEYHLENQYVQPQDWIDSTLQDLFLLADIVEFYGHTTIIELQDNHHLDSNDVQALLDDANEQNEFNTTAGKGFKLGFFTNDTIHLILD